MLHLLAQLLCSCDSFFHEFWPSVNVACQWNAHSLPPCLYIVMGWPCAVRNSEELWHCAVMCCLLQCSLSMSKHLLFFLKWNSLSSACQQQLGIMHTSVWTHKKMAKHSEWDRPWLAKCGISFRLEANFNFLFSLVRFEGVFVPPPPPLLFPYY